MMIWYATKQVWFDLALIQLWSDMLQYNYDLICYTTIMIWYATIQLWSDMATIQFLSDIEQ